MPDFQQLFHSSPFKPTPESIPPKHVVYRMNMPSPVPAHITPLNPIHFLLRAALICPDKLAIAHPGPPNPAFYTFADWAQRVQNLAYALIEAGIQPGERVAVIAPNTPMIADAHQGILAARAVICPINIRLTKDVVDYIIEHSGSKLILVDRQFAHLVQGTPVPTIVCHDTGRADDPYERFLARGRRFSRERGWQGLDLEMNEDANASLCYTSGTTGRPKGVISTLRGSYLAAISNAYETKLDRSSTYLWILPMFHACGWTFPWACTFAFSTQLIIRAVEYDVIWHHINNSNVTHYCGAPTVQIGIVNSPYARKLDSARFVTAIIAGAAPTSHLISQLERLGIKVTHVYGLTETYGPFTRNYYRPLHPIDEKVGLHDGDARIMARQGHAFANSDEARVVYRQQNGEPLDAPLRDVPDDGNTLGEIVVRGNIVMKEYFRDPEATRKAFRGGHFNTGDLAVRNPDGSLSIQDRSKDLIISGGENASSLAIEQELAKHPDVQEVTVVARAHPTWGERAMAFVMLHTHSSFKSRVEEFEKELKAFAAKVLPGFARPEWVTVVDELPKTGTGKVLKHVLRSRAAKL
ncbi:acetyl-CoA synthetase-like protein [Cantharellus anzutake]|uniref:acetyl-CoA synthetase-like protein n=1 Tax=Cantharellus anzutake TaxID=1750568 RepID=UPI001905A465|nr:acetyl-CoA synthetase-like protein [Cantharellus anzutake]KAF8332389.1 acetyl-CoA synthetase-like protein [Cantharellus anzutake]